ncbi:hypothetical protein mRhiFer1_008347 [Rhinolophus ferrumequinum]|uniref:Uncharacterized protein n=1 Tax=Rhinolophus ferrumequinum TaxID=59479 RepID=A0A7J7VE04_RHIFE|nr:hypothetical protein mRhiFer1_008347 [Rhinolophus ferrumequinum]
MPIRLLSSGLLYVSVEDGEQAGHPSVRPGVLRRHCMKLCRPLTMSPVPCSGVSFGIQSLPYASANGKAQPRRPCHELAAPPRRPGGRSGEGCSFITRRWVPVAVAAAWPLWGLGGLLVYLLLGDAMAQEPAREVPVRQDGPQHELARCRLALAPEQADQGYLPSGFPSPPPSPSSPLPATAVAQRVWLQQALLRAVREGRILQLVLVRGPLATAQKAGVARAARSRRSSQACLARAPAGCFLPWWSEGSSVALKCREDSQRRRQANSSQVSSVLPR